MAAASQPSEPETKSEEDRNLGESMEEENGIELGQVGDVFTVQVGATYSCQRKDGTYLNCHQNEWVDKTRLVLVKQEEEEEEEEAEAAAAHEALQEASGYENQSVKLDEDEPKAKKIKVDPPGNSSVRVSDDLAEELTCPLCNELFKEPVVVKCGHNFCCGCLDKAWAGQDSFTCPACNEVINDKKFSNNRALAKLVKKTADAFAVPAAVLTPAKSVAKEKPRVNCLVHDEKLKLFCKDDGDLSCFICRDSLKHTYHSFLPIMDAVCVYKTELSTLVTPLEDALKVAEQMAKNQNEKIVIQKTTMKEFREHIESEFQKMYNFLKGKEQKLLEKLQEEGESLLMEMEDNYAKIEENISCIKQSIATTSEKLNDTDSVSFLTDIKMLLKKCQDQQKEALSFENTFIDKELNIETYKAPEVDGLLLNGDMGTNFTQTLFKQLVDKWCERPPQAPQFKSQRGYGRNRGRLGSRQRVRGGCKDRSYMCFNCRQYGHWKHDCPLPDFMEGGRQPGLGYGEVYF
ncbi:nuclear factor 7, brain-like [Pyxicephalus adspersus]|uniref:nuclear factor 7, brain-like n=1 Tax=Pyxicephalus adspersus TaxID=30357 RepID=UPI003B5B9B49